MELLNQQEKQCSQDMKIIEKQHHEDIQRQKKSFSKLLEKCSRESDQGNSNSFSQGSEINSVGEFWYRPEEKVTFAAYFRKYQDIFFKK